MKIVIVYFYDGEKKWFPYSLGTLGLIAEFSDRIEYFEIVQEG
jgi:hypothetical protein